MTDFSNSSHASMISLLPPSFTPRLCLYSSSDQICDSIGRNTGAIAAVADRDSIIALSGAPKRELLSKANSQELAQLMEQRKSYRYSPGGVKLQAAEDVDRYHLGVAAPILSGGDLMGCVMLLMDESEKAPAESDQKLVQTVASFLGRQMEN